ncbi:hypothetical protein ACQCWA_19385 [Rossellomorea aquimaris]
MILKSTVLQINLFIGLAGVLTTYFSNAVKIPYWVFLILPFIALFYTGYLIYKNSSPSITIIPPDEDDLEVRYASNMSFEIVMKSRITNFGTRSGSLEDIKLHYIGFNSIKDEFLLKNLRFSVDEPQILKKRPNPILSLKPWDFEFRCPLIVSVDKNDYLYFYTKFHVGSYFGYGEEDKKEALKWLKTLDFELEYKYKDTHKTYVKKSKIIINTDDFYDLYEKGIKEEEELEEALKGM